MAAVSPSIWTRSFAHHTPAGRAVAYGAAAASFSSVIPAKAGIQLSASRYSMMDAGFRRHDDKKRSWVSSDAIALPPQLIDRDPDRIVELLAS
jgi:hypothetical protein